MSALTDRINAVLRRHMRDDVAAVVAAAVVAELQPEHNRQLTEAWNAGFKEGLRVQP